MKPWRGFTDDLEEDIDDSEHEDNEDDGSQGAESNNTDADDNHGSSDIERSPGAGDDQDGRTVGLGTAVSAGRDDVTATRRNVTGGARRSARLAQQSSHLKTHRKYHYT